MPTNNTVMDGAGKYGSFPIVVKGVTYVLNEFAPSRPTSGTVDNGAMALPSRAVHTIGMATFSATAQIATGTTAYPQFGDKFVVNTDPNYGDETWIILEAVPKISNDTNFTTLSISGYKAINPDAITVT